MVDSREVWSKLYKFGKEAGGSSAVWVSEGKFVELYWDASVGVLTAYLSEELIGQEVQNWYKFIEELFSNYRPMSEVLIAPL